jgi:hypothetical protein
MSNSMTHQGGKTTIWQSVDGAIPIAKAHIVSRFTCGYYSQISPTGPGKQNQDIFQRRVWMHSNFPRATGRSTEQRLKKILCQH